MLTYSSPICWITIFQIVCNLNIKTFSRDKCIYRLQNFKNTMTVEVFCNFNISYSNFIERNLLWLLDGSTVVDHSTTDHAIRGSHPTLAQHLEKNGVEKIVKLWHQSKIETIPFSPWKIKKCWHLLIAVTGSAIK